MTNEPQTYRLLVTLPNLTGEQADEYVEDLEASLTGKPVGPTLPYIEDATVAYAPELWIAMVDGPDFDRVFVAATEQHLADQVRDYLNDEYEAQLDAGLSMNGIEIQAFVDGHFVISHNRYDYPVHPE